MTLGYRIALWLMIIATAGFDYAGFLIWEPLGWFSIAVSCFAWACAFYVAAKDLKK